MDPWQIGLYGRSAMMIILAASFIMTCIAGAIPGYERRIHDRKISLFMAFPFSSFEYIFFMHFVGRVSPGMVNLVAVLIVAMFLLTSVHMMCSDPD